MQPSLRRHRLRRTTALIAGLTLCVAGGSAVVAGFTSSLGGMSTALGAWSQALAADAPTVVTCDNFEGPDGDLSGRAVSSTARCGSIAWTVHRGAWSVVSGHTVVDGTVDAAATLPTASVDVAVAATVAGGGGLVVAHDGTDSYLAVVLTPGTPGRADLVLMADGVPSTVTSADVTVGGVTSLSLTRLGADVIVTIAGVTVIDHTLSSDDIAALGAGDRAGLYASNASSQFDNLRVTTPSPG